MATRTVDDEAIQAEIDNHGRTWCSEDCYPGNTFLPEEYRVSRLRGSSAESLQRSYDSCHIWR